MCELKVHKFTSALKPQATNRLCDIRKKGTETGNRRYNILLKHIISVADINYNHVPLFQRNKSCCLVCKINKQLNMSRISFYVKLSVLFFNAIL
jgi:hypothetical protein